MSLKAENRLKVNVSGLIIIVFLISALQAFPRGAESTEFREPWKSPVSASTFKSAISGRDMASEHEVTPTYLLMFPFVLYHRYLTVIDGRTCPCSPSCSTYSLQSFSRHGAFLGLLFTIDRLIHEADEIRHGRFIRVNDRYLCYDPLSENDFWL